MFNILFATNNMEQWLFAAQQLQALEPTINRVSPEEQGSYDVLKQTIQSLPISAELIERNIDVIRALFQGNDSSSAYGRVYGILSAEMNQQRVERIENALFDVVLQNPQQIYFRLIMLHHPNPNVQARARFRGAINEIMACRADSPCVPTIVGKWKLNTEKISAIKQRLETESFSDDTRAFYAQLFKIWDIYKIRQQQARILAMIQNKLIEKPQSTPRPILKDMPKDVMSVIGQYHNVL